MGSLKQRRLLCYPPLPSQVVNSVLGRMPKKRELRRFHCVNFFISFASHRENSYNQFYYNTERRQKHSLCQTFIHGIIISLILKVSIRAAVKRRSDTIKKSLYAQGIEGA